MSVIRSRESWVDISDWSGTVAILPVLVVIAPEDVMVDICFVVVSVQVCKLVSVVIDKHLDVMHRVVGLVGAEVVSAQSVVVLEAGVVVLLSVVSAMVLPVMLPCVMVVMVAEEVPMVLVVVTIVVLIMLIVEVGFVTVVMELTGGKAVHKISNMALIQVMLMIFLGSSHVLPLHLHSVLLLFAAGLILVWCHSELLLVVLVVVVPLVEAVDASLAVSLVEVSVVAVVDNVCPVDLVIEVSMLVLVLMRVVAVEMVVMGGSMPLVLVMVRLIVPVVILEAVHVGVVVGRSMVRVRIVGIVCVVEVPVVRWRDMGIVRVRMASVEWNAVLHLLAEEDLGKSKTYVVAELIVMLVFPLGHCVH